VRPIGAVQKDPEWKDNDRERDWREMADGFSGLEIVLGIITILVDLKLS
jgi:hypothetical protein